MVLGIVFLAHGIKHARGRERTSAWFGSIGFRNPQFQWFASTATEIGMGVLLLLGLGTSLAAAGVIGILTVAYWTWHRGVGFFVTERPIEGWEYVLTLALFAFALALAGPGRISVDQVFGIADDLDGWVGFVLAAGGVGVSVLQIATFWRPGSVGEETN